MAQWIQPDRVGPIYLADGVRPHHVLTKFYAAIVTIAMLSGMSLLQPYILTEHLGISRGVMGSVSGQLAFWTELLAIFLIPIMGIISDRIGRRPVFVVGLLIVGLGYGLYPFATSVNELLAYRLVFAVGMSAVAAMVATLNNDYPQERSRGMMISISSMMNIIGTVIVSAGISRIPSLVTSESIDAIEAGKIMFLVCTGWCLISSMILQLGLKPGLAVSEKKRVDTKTLVMAGFKYGATNPRIALSYAGAFAARSDVVIKGLFLSAWAAYDAAEYGLTIGQAMGRFGALFAFMSLASFVSAIPFGWLIDNINRVTAFLIALGFATAGYLSMGIITSPLDMSMLPYFIILSLGSSFMMKSSLSLIGQEAPPEQRGSIIATNGMFGAVGILFFTLIGGYTFDAWGPWSPFVLAGIYKVFLILVALLVRWKAPGTVAVGRWGQAAITPKPDKKPVAAKPEESFTADKTNIADTQKPSET